MDLVKISIYLEWSFSRKYENDNATHSGFFRSNKIHGWHHGRKLGQFYNLLLSPLFFFFLNPFSRFVSTWFPICLNDTNVLPNPISLCFTLSLSYSLSQLQPLSLSVTPSLSYTLSLLHPLSLTPSLSYTLSVSLSYTDTR